MVGAKSPTEIGLFYQWGDVVGHVSSDSYNFNTENYESKGLSLITSDLNDSQDAARYYYGPSAKMPSKQQLEELIQYTTFEVIRPYVFQFTSTVNGNKLIVAGFGYFNANTQQLSDQLFAWSSTYHNYSEAWSLHNNQLSVSYRRRWGLNIMAVHS